MSGTRIVVETACSHGQFSYHFGCDGGSRSRVLTPGEYVLIEREGGHWNLPQREGLYWHDDIEIIIDEIAEEFWPGVEFWSADPDHTEGT